MFPTEFSTIVPTYYALADEKEVFPRILQFWNSLKYVFLESGCYFKHKKKQNESYTISWSQNQRITSLCIRTRIWEQCFCILSVLVGEEEH